MIYIIHTCELGRMGTRIANPSKEQMAWALNHKFMCNVTLPTIKRRPEKPPKPVKLVTPRPTRVELKPPNRPIGRPTKRVEPKKE